MLWTVVLEKTPESPLDCKEIKPVSPKGNQSWIFIGRSAAEAETPIFWPPHAKSWLIGKDSGAGRDWGQEEKGATEDEMAGWHHWLNGHESEWTPGDGDGQGGLACCDSWGCKESDTTEWLNWTESSAYSNMLLSRHPCIVMVLSPAKLPIMLLISIVDNTEYLIDVSVLSILRVFSVRDTYQTYWCRC